jgi:hypothetical protein
MAIASAESALLRIQWSLVHSGRLESHNERDLQVSAARSFGGQQALHKSFLAGSRPVKSVFGRE